MTRWNGINRTAVLHIRLAEDEKRELEKAARRAGQPVGAWIRTLSLERAQRDAKRENKR